MVKIPSQKTCHTKIFLILVKQRRDTNSMEWEDDKQALCGQSRRAVPPNKYTHCISSGWYAEDCLSSPVKTEGYCMKSQLEENLKAGLTVFSLFSMNLNFLFFELSSPSTLLKTITSDKVVTVYALLCVSQALQSILTQPYTFCLQAWWSPKLMFRSSYLSSTNICLRGLSQKTIVCKIFQSKSLNFCILQGIGKSTYLLLITCSSEKERISTSCYCFLLFFKPRL